jgi:2,3-bisphosphoglycerate-dependent phosphoglycerate mutase
MSFLILIRHGDSRWNSANKFTGWVDVPLSDNGIREARNAAKALQGIKVDVAFTSKLVRAEESLLIILAKQQYTGIFVHKTKKRKKWEEHKMDKKEIPIYSSDELNERYYGKLQGMDKNHARKKFGEDKVFSWRRSFKGKPPGGESLEDTFNRVIPYFKKEILPYIKKKKNVLICAHGNSLRALIKYLDIIPEEKIPQLNLPTGQAIVYQNIRGKLVKQKHVHSFTRPLCWNNPRCYVKK